MNMSRVLALILLLLIWFASASVDLVIEKYIRGVNYTGEQTRRGNYLTFIELYGKSFYAHGYTATLKGSITVRGVVEDKVLVVVNRDLVEKIADPGDEIEITIRSASGRLIVKDNYIEVWDVEATIINHSNNTIWEGHVKEFIPYTVKFKNMTVEGSANLIVTTSHPLSTICIKMKWIYCLQEELRRRGEDRDLIREYQRLLRVRR